ncbi:MAG: glycosyltransferase [Rickettsiales bacterium]|jgi:glycosyltransferase involved in cell wall biosynthesis|nr:glycosyltransferase [Rickettsiales bacterium]
MKKKLVFFADIMIMGGAEMVLKNLLDVLKIREDLEIVVVGKVRHSYFRNWFRDNRERIKLIDNTACPRRKKRWFLREIFFLLRLHAARGKARRALKGAFAAIDFKNGYSQEIIYGFRGRKIMWFHGGTNSFFNDRAHDVSEILKYDKIVLLTESMKNDFATVFPQHARKAAQIYNIIPIADIVKKVDVGMGGKYFVSVSRLNNDKDPATIILGFDKFWRDGGKPDVKLYIIGDGPMRKIMQNLANELESKKQIIFTGTIPEPYGYMKGAMAHILSSPQEGLPTAIIEAAACGTLNISSDCKSGPREILMDGKAGLLFPVGEYAKLAQIMSDVYHGKVDCAKMIANANAGLARFSSDSIVPKVMETIGIDDAA